jgi:hypothetical protein
MNAPLAFAAAATTAAFFVVVASRGRRRPRRRPRACTKPDETGIDLIAGEIVVTDPTRAFNWLAIAADPAIRRGASAEELLVDVFRRRFPKNRWPPDPTTPQWTYMVERVNALLRSPPPPSKGRLRLVG